MSPKRKLEASEPESIAPLVPSAASSSSSQSLLSQLSDHGIPHLPATPSTTVVEPPRAAATWWSSILNYVPTQLLRNILVAPICYAQKFKVLTVVRADGAVKKRLTEAGRLGRDAQTKTRSPKKSKGRHSQLKVSFKSTPTIHTYSSSPCTPKPAVNSAYPNHTFGFESSLLPGDCRPGIFTGSSSPVRNVPGSWPEDATPATIGVSLPQTTPARYSSDGYDTPPSGDGYITTGSDDGYDATSSSLAHLSQLKAEHTTPANVELDASRIHTATATASDNDYIFDEAGSSNGNLNQPSAVSAFGKPGSGEDADVEMTDAPGYVMEQLANESTLDPEALMNEEDVDLTLGHSRHRPFDENDIRMFNGKRNICDYDKDTRRYPSPFFPPYSGRRHGARPALRNGCIKYPHIAVKTHPRSDENTSHQAWSPANAKVQKSSLKRPRRPAKPPVRFRDEASVKFFQQYVDTTSGNWFQTGEEHHYACVDPVDNLDHPDTWTVDDDAYATENLEVLDTREFTAPFQDYVRLVYPHAAREIYNDSKVFSELNQALLEIKDLKKTQGSWLDTEVVAEIQNKALERMKPLAQKAYDSQDDLLRNIKKMDQKPSKSTPVKENDGDRLQPSISQWELEQEIDDSLLGFEGAYENDGDHHIESHGEQEDFDEEDHESESDFDELNEEEQNCDEDHESESDSDELNEEEQDCNEEGYVSESEFDELSSKFDEEVETSEGQRDFTKENHDVSELDVIEFSEQEHKNSDETSQNAQEHHEYETPSNDDAQNCLAEQMFSLELAHAFADDTLPTPVGTPPPASSTVPVTPLMAPLTDLEIDALNKAAEKTMNGTNKKAVVSKFDRAELTAHDFGTLIPDVFKGNSIAWLNDDIVNEYIGILVNHIKNKANYQHKRGNPAPPVHAFRSQWYKSMVENPNSVKRWPGRVQLDGKNFLDCQLVLFPICEGQHWRLVAVKPQERLIEYYDSLNGSGRHYTSLVMEFIQMILGEDFVESDWAISQEQKSKQQTNASDCGVFTVINALVLLRGQSEHGRVEVATGMNDARLRVAATLLAGAPTTEMD